MNEFQLVEKLSKVFGRPTFPHFGIGDDAAIFRPKKDADLLWTTDTQVEGIHFKRKWLRPREIGWRAATGALSDIAAMGGSPWYALVSFHTPTHRTRDLTEVARGIRDRCSKYGMTILGGNLTRSPTFSIDISVIGGVKKGMTLSRSGARPGDDVYISGFPGRGALALALFKRFDFHARSHAMVSSWIHSLPRIELGKKLIRIATAAIDVSDGLIADAKRLAEASQVNLKIDGTKWITNRRIQEASRKLHSSPKKLLFGPSDDYELLFSAPRSVREKLSKFKEVSRIGKALKGNGKVSLNIGGTKVYNNHNGWDHFNKNG